MTTALKQRREFSLETWEHLVNDPARLELLFAMGRGYNRTFDDVDEAFRILQRCQTDSYLVDFDVISDILAVDTPVAESDLDYADVIARRKFQTYSWFRHSRRNFWIPWGAFQELQFYLRNFAAIQRKFKRNRIGTNLGHDLAMQALASALGISMPETLNREDLNHEIIQQLKDSQLKLTRLNEFLDPKQFFGVRARSDDQIAGLLYEWIRACPRFARTKPRDSPPSKRTLTYRRDNDVRDRRDAQNIAIAIESVIDKINHTGTECESPESHVFVTATRILLDLADPSSLMLDEWPHIPEERRPQRNYSAAIMPAGSLGGWRKVDWRPARML